MGTQWGINRTILDGRGLVFRGAMGTQWGINRTMAQIHALLMIELQPMDTESVMEQLEISRGNAHTNLKELVSWGLIRIVVKKGERREYFEAEKDAGSSS